jgi:uncharacterized protein YndB with AHSA1/START domain
MTSNTSAGTRILGSLRSADGKGIVRLEDRYETDIDDLWSALTDPRRLARWLVVGEITGDLRLGGEFHARFTSDWEGTVRVDGCEPPRRLLLTFDPDLPHGDVIEAQLAPDGDQTVLVVEVRDIRLDQLADYGAGNQVHLEDLAAHIAGRERCDIEARWSELVPFYQDLAAKVG